jgi:hypothetical protein
VHNLYANHLGHTCKKEQLAEDMSLKTYRAELTKLLENMYKHAGKDLQRKLVPKDQPLLRCLSDLY